MRGAREETEDQAADHEHDGIRNLETLGQRRKSGDKKQEKKEDDFNAVDAGGFHGVRARISHPEFLIWPFDSRIVRFSCPGYNEFDTNLPPEPTPEKSRR